VLRKYQIKECKIVLNDINIKFSKTFNKESQRAAEIIPKPEDIKKERDQHFLQVSNQLPKPIKLELTRKTLRSTRKPLRFSEFKCNICGKFLSNRRALKDHQERHFKPSLLECKKCKKPYKYKIYFI
jgi:hypothetical protein